MKPIHAFLLFLALMIITLWASYSEVLFRATVVLLLLTITIILTMKGRGNEHL